MFYAFIEKHQGTLIKASLEFFFGYKTKRIKKNY
jgi:hypothetical protein